MSPLEVEETEEVELLDELEDDIEDDELLLAELLDDWLDSSVNGAVII